MIDLLSNPAQAVAPEAELDLRRSHASECRAIDVAREGKYVSAKEFLGLARKRGAVLTEADTRAIEELKNL